MKKKLDTAPPWQDTETLDLIMEHRDYDTNAPIHSFRAMKEALDAGEISRPDVIPLLTLGANTELRSPIIKGWLHLYTGAPKVGKTELLFQTILNWRDERRTLWLSEEGFGVWVEKAHRTPWSVVEGDFHFAYARDKDEAWMVSVIEQMDDNGGLDVVVVDTIKMLGIEEENNPAQISRAFSPFANICAKRGITVILVHHNRKAGGKFGEEVSGSNAFAGSVDVIISLSRNSQNDGDNKRICEVNGRSDNLRFMYELDKESKEMRILGDAATAHTMGLRVRILDGLAARTEDSLTATQLRDKIAGDGQVSKAVINKQLQAMAEAGTILRIPDISEGTVQGKTPRWTLKED